MEEILSQMSFDDGVALPIANEANKKFEKQVEEKRKDIERLHQNLDRYGERIQSMSQHLKNVKQERVQTQELCNARDREIKTEEHLRLLAEREDGRLRAEIRRHEKELETIKDRKNICENNIFKGTEKLERMKEQMNWDQQALDAWLKESAIRDEDAIVLYKYTKDDDSKIKELSLKQEKLIVKCAQRRRSLEQESIRTLTSQLELDKISETFRDSHRTRQDLLHQWELTVKQMQKRDAEMESMSLQLLEIKSELKNKQHSLKEKQQFLANEITNNNEKENKISAAERQAAKFRLTYQDVERGRVQFHDELEALKYTVERTGRDLDSSRKEANALRKEIEARNEKLSQVKATRKELEEQSRLAQDSRMTSEDRVKLLELHYKHEEHGIVQSEKELDKLREIRFKKTEELHQAMQSEVTSRAEIQGANAANRNLNSMLNKLDQESIKQQEIIYNQDFQLQQLERRMARLKGDRSNEENQQLEKRIAELSSILEDHQSKHTILTAQLKKLNGDLRRAHSSLSKYSDEDKDLNGKIGEFLLHNSSSQRELKNVTCEKQELMVDENILRLKLQGLRDQLNNRANEVLSLQDRKLLLDTAMKERTLEIDVHNDMLKAQIKSHEDMRHKMSSELHEKISKIDKLRKRYEILTISMAPPEGEEDDSEAYYVIKAAQEKEDLQRTGDELDAKIRKAEKEIRALENTLHLMNSRNETYRKGFSSVDETSEEYEEKMAMEEQYRVAVDKCKYKRRRVKELQDDLAVMNNTAETLSTEESNLLDVMEEKQRESENLRKELDGQKEKKARADKMLTKLAREVRFAQNTKEELPEERDMSLRELRDLNKNILKDISEAATLFPQITSALELCFDQAGLTFPTSPSSRSSTTTSNRSNLSSASSMQSLRSDGSSARNQREVLETSSLDLGLDAFNSQSPAATQTKSHGSGKTTPIGSKGRSSRSPTKASRSSSRSSTGSKTDQK